eukprot:g40080.t1
MLSSESPRRASNSYDNTGDKTITEGENEDELTHMHTPLSTERVVFHDGNSARARSFRQPLSSQERKSTGRPGLPPASLDDTADLANEVRYYTYLPGAGVEWMSMSSDMQS